MNSTFAIWFTYKKGYEFVTLETSYNKLDDLLEKAFTTYQRLTQEESGGVDWKLQYQ
jgi:hypothetical protein